MIISDVRESAFDQTDDESLISPYFVLVLSRLMVLRRYSRDELERIVRHDEGARVVCA